MRRKHQNVRKQGKILRYTGPGQGVVPLRRAGKKMRAPLLGLAKSVYYAGKLVSSSSWFGRTGLLAYLTVRTLGIE